VTERCSRLSLFAGEMRLDLFLKTSRLVPRRTVAREMCDARAIRVNNAEAKGSREVRVGDQITIRQRGRITTVRVLEVPASQLPKARARSIYEVLGVETYGDEV
jgi:ribosomal 50S subunit-recycling heat shock protein